MSCSCVPEDSPARSGALPDRLANTLAEVNRALSALRRGARRELCVVQLPGGGEYVSDRVVRGSTD